MASTMHKTNFGTQVNVACSLNTKVPVPGAGETETYAIPSGYLLVGPPTGITDNGDGTYTVAETYASAPIEFVSDGSVGHEVTDTAGVAIEANTVDQSSL